MPQDIVNTDEQIEYGKQFYNLLHMPLTCGVCGQDMSPDLKYDDKEQIVYIDDNSIHVRH